MKLLRPDANAEQLCFKMRNPLSGLMAAGLAAELEKRELERIEGLSYTLQTPLAEVRTLITGIAPARKGRAWVSHGINAAALTAPLFYEQPFVLGCEGCEITQDPELLRYVSEKGLVIPVLASRYSAYSKETLEALASAPHMSSQAVLTLRKFASDATGGCYCPDCTKQKVRNYSRLKKSDREWLDEACIPGLTNLPGEVQLERVTALNAAIKMRSSKKIEEEGYRIRDIAFFADAAAMAARPQLVFHWDENDKPSTDDLARTLGVMYSTDIDTREYIDIIADYRGVLSGIVSSAADWRGMVEKATYINKQVVELDRSRRAKFVNVASDVLGGESRPAIEALIGGMLGWLTVNPAVGVACAAGIPLLDRSLEETLKRAADKLKKSNFGTHSAALYFGKSTEAVHVSRLRAELHAARADE